MAKKSQDHPIKERQKGVGVRLFHKIWRSRTYYCHEVREVLA